MDFENILASITADYDLESAVGRREAYNRCFEYAEEHFPEAREFNAFMLAAAKRLRQPRIIRDEIRDAIPLSGDEKVHLAVDAVKGPQLTGNSEGLHHLGEVLIRLARTDNPGESVFFSSREAPLYGRSHGFRILLEDGDWFEEHGSLPFFEEPFSSSHPLRHRQMKADDIVALVLNVTPPPQLMLSENKLYRVLEHRPHDLREELVSDEGALSKQIREDTSRLYYFRVRCDDGEPRVIGLDLDDPDVQYFLEEHLEQCRCSD